MMAVSQTQPLSSNDVHNSTMKSISAPDLSELKEIRDFEDALFCDRERDVRPSFSAVSQSSLTSPSASTSDLIDVAPDFRINPSRIVSLGLHRSISMPREQETDSCTNVKEVLLTSEPNDGYGTFFIPSDDEGNSDGLDGDSQHSQTFLPRFYSVDKLSTLIPPASKRWRSQTSREFDSSLDQMKDPSIAKVGKQSTRDVTEEPVASECCLNKQLDQRNRRRDKRNSQAQARENAVSKLESFFLGKTQSSKNRTSHPSPQSVNAFHTTEGDQASKVSSIERPEESVSSRRPVPLSVRVPKTAQVANVVPKHPNITSSCGELESKWNSDGFVMLQHGDRAHSMPKSLPSSSAKHSPFSGSLPRRSSLKKVSSYKSLGNNSGSGEGVSTSGIRPNVSFSNLSIREYEVTLGDNPSCSSGPPISLGWEYRDTAVVPVDDYETTRKLHFPRRHSTQLMLSYNVRRYLLLKTAGYTKAELREAMKEVERIKRERKVTDMLRPAILDEVMEDVVEKVKTMFGARA